MKLKETEVSAARIHNLDEFADLLSQTQLLSHVFHGSRNPDANQNADSKQEIKNPEVNHDSATLTQIDKISSREIAITDITFDSRKVRPGTLFICKGATFKEEYLTAAIASGAVAYLSETKYDVDLPALIVSDIRKAMALVARHFFDYPDQKLHLIGVTATKGKSTTVYMIKSVFDAALAAAGEKPCGLLSGIEIYDGKTTRAAHLTTDESVELIRNLASCVENGLHYCVVEISSQALKYERVAGIEFDTCSFINIGRDHISAHEHPDFSDYFAAKLRITEHTKNFIYHASMDHVAEVKAKAAREGVAAYTISFESEQSGASDLSVQVDACDNTSQKNNASQINAALKTHLAEQNSAIKKTDNLPKRAFAQIPPQIPNRVFLISNVHTDSCGSHFTLNGEDYTITMPGLFNIENAAVAIACGILAGFSPVQIAQGLRDVRVPGRSELSSTADGKIHCFVDYAHNALSFEKALQSLRALYPDAHLLALFGAPGNKAYNRRKDLPCAAAKYAHEIYLLPEDTDTEDVMEIVKEVAANIPEQVPYMIFDDRSIGITAAFEMGAAKVKMDPNAEFVLFVAGKGQEAFMKIAGGYAPYAGDHEIVKQLIASYDAKL